MCSKNQLVPDFLVCRIEENALRLQFLDQSPCLSSGLHQAASKAAPLFPPSLGGITACARASITAHFFGGRSLNALTLGDPAPEQAAFSASMKPFSVRVSHSIPAPSKTCPLNPSTKSLRGEKRKNNPFLNRIFASSGR